MADERHPRHRALNAARELVSALEDLLTVPPAKHMTTAQVIARHGVTGDLVRTEVHRGHLVPAGRRGRELVFDVEELDRWAAGK